MVRSMTGYGGHELAAAEYKITVEIKSVNHRYCDISIKIPKKFAFYENVVRTQIKKYTSRGKIDVFIFYEDYTEGNLNVTYNKDIAASYISELGNLSKDFLLENSVDTYKIACFPEVFKVEEKKLDEEKLQQMINDTLDEAGRRLVESRETEGSRLKEDILSKLEELLAYIEKIEKRTPEILTAHREKLMAKVKELLGERNVDDSVLVSELVVFADKICVDEETVRLRSHIENVRNTLEEGDSVGRKLDFIAQEMNREANTILSKANDLDVSNYAINLKTEIEKIREQIQNIE